GAEPTPDGEVATVGHGELGERDRVLLSIAERADAVALEPAGAEGLRVLLTGRGSPRMAAEAIRASRNRGWDSYRSIERYMTAGETCRRRQLLDHFGDDEAAGDFAPAGPPVDEQSFEVLRAWRFERADGKPAFTVAANTVLENVLRAAPRSVEELLAIRGIGPAFCEKHGQSLLATLAEIDATSVA